MCKHLLFSTRRCLSEGTAASLGIDLVREVSGPRHGMYSRPHNVNSCICTEMNVSASSIQASNLPCHVFEILEFTALSNGCGAPGPQLGRHGGWPRGPNAVLLANSSSNFASLAH